MKEAEVLKCQVQEWYPRYKSVSVATEIHKLPESFVSYILDDAFILPVGSDAMPSRLTPAFPELQAEDYEKWEEEEEEQGERQDVKTFPELEAAVRASIERLGGAVMPKLNWSAPKDAVWMSSSKNLKCTSFGEVSLLLKASDSVVHDLCHAFDNCEDKSQGRPEEFVLALRKWYDLRPEMEFRAFVRGGVLVGLCQREVTGFYPSLLRSRESIQEGITRFFKDKLSGTFELENYTFDVYVTKDLRVKLLDFNPWGGSTLPLLFTWEELENCEAGGVASEASTGIEFRIIESEGLVQPNLTATSGVPLDYVDTGPGSAWDVFLKRAEEEMRNQDT